MKDAGGNVLAAVDRDWRGLGLEVCYISDTPFVSNNKATFLLGSFLRN